MYSNYNVYLQDVPYESYTTIFNLLSKELICLDSIRIDNEEFSDEILDKLKDKKMIVDSSDSEINEAIERYNYVTHNQDILNITIALTGKCNCRCIYCFEKDMDLNFNSITEMKTIIKKIDEKMLSYKKLIITFFGGEPLLCKDNIRYISKYFFNKYNNNYEFAIITNGTLIDRNDILEYMKLGLVCLKITLDGCKESHNQRRINSKNNCYETILSNLNDISDISGLQIIIGAIVDDQVFGIGEMVSDVKAVGIDAEYCLSICEPDIYDPICKADILLRNALDIKNAGGYQYSKIATNHDEICAGKQCNMFIIDGKGAYYSCTPMIDKAIGHIENGLLKTSIPIKHDCIKCQYLPICYGDCIYQRKCNKEFFEYLIPRWIKMFIQ